jgi:formylglycine-generating enzyme required for sulfatase activity
VENVSWFDAVRFCNRLSVSESLLPAYLLRGEDYRTETGRGYQLLTEAQWEWVCRSGSEGDVCPTVESDNPADYGWMNQNTKGLTQEVAQLPSNAFGIHDMLGNVAEWCWDWYAPDFYSRSPGADPAGPDSGEMRVVRGGQVLGGVIFSRSSARRVFPPQIKGGSLGFRVILPLEAARKLLSATDR